MWQLVPSQGCSRPPSPHVGADSQRSAQGFRASSQAPPPLVSLGPALSLGHPDGTGCTCALSLAPKGRAGAAQLPALRTAGERCSCRSVGLAAHRPLGPGLGLHGDRGQALTGEAAQDLLPGTGQPCVACAASGPQGGQGRSEPCPGCPQKGRCFPRVLWGGQAAGWARGLGLLALHGGSRGACGGREGGPAGPGLGSGVSCHLPVLHSSGGFSRCPGSSLQAGAGTAQPLPWLWLARGWPRAAVCLGVCGLTLACPPFPAAAPGGLRAVKRAVKSSKLGAREAAQSEFCINHQPIGGSGFTFPGAALSIIPGAGQESLCVRSVCAQSRAMPRRLRASGGRDLRGAGGAQIQSLGSRGGFSACLELAPGAWGHPPGGLGPR